MLRRIHRTVATPALARAFWTTPQHATLVNTKAERGYEHDLWLGLEDDVWWTAKSSQLKEGAEQRAVTAYLPKRLEFYNASQLREPFDMAEPTEHSSVSTGKAYKGKMLTELKQRAVMNDYSSKWWMTPNVVRQRGLQIQARNRPHAVLLTVPIKVVNVAEFVDPAAIMSVPISADSGRPLFSDVRLPLEQAVSARGYATSIFYTEATVGELGLGLKDDASPVTTTSSDVNTFYNIEDFANPDMLTRPDDYVADPSKPRYLTTGTALTMPHVLEALTAAGYSESLWMSHKDLQFKQQQAPEKFALKPGVAGVSVPAFASSWYNVEEMNDVEAAMKAVGTLTR